LFTIEGTTYFRVNGKYGKTINPDTGVKETNGAAPKRTRYQGIEEDRI
jgi:hypothetical protein